MDDSLDISNSKSKSFDDQISNKLKIFDEEITNKHLFWPSSSVCKPSELDKISIEDSRESLIKSCLSRIKDNVKELYYLEHNHLFWPHLSVSKTNELDKISLEDASRFPPKLYMIKYNLEELCDLEEHYLSDIKQLSNEFDKISIEDLNDISLMLHKIDFKLKIFNNLVEKYLFAIKQLSNELDKISLEDPRQLQNILDTIKKELEILNNLNIGTGEDQIHKRLRFHKKHIFHKRRYDVTHKYKSEIKNRENKFQSIFEQKYIDKQLSNDEQLSIDEQISADKQLSNDEQLSIDEQISADKQLSNDEQLSNDDQLSIDEKLLNDEQIHKYLKNNYQILINSKNKEWPSKNLFEEIEKYLNSIDKNDELKQKLLNNKSIDKKEKQFLDCVMTSLSILCELSDNCEDYATNIHNNTQIINPLLNLLERFSHNQYSLSIADQLLETIVFIFTNLSRRLNNLTKANWIIYLEQCLNNKKLREIIHISAALAIAFQYDEDFQDSLNVRLLINKGYERANANANKEWSGFSLEEFREGLDKLKL